MTGHLRLVIRFPLVVACILGALLIMPVFSVLRLGRVNRVVMRVAFRLGAIVLGVRIHTQGKLATGRPLLLVSNHFSYLDLFAIGSLVPAAFTPKSEIGGWPIIGVLCKMAGCVFIDRRASQTLQNRATLEQAKHRGDVISLFPEGTTGEGKQILPFKSSYFSLAESSGLMVQPLSVVYTHLNGKPVDEAALPLIGWYGDMYLFPHLMVFLRQKHVDVTLAFHAPVSGKEFANRKELARHCQHQVEKSFFVLQPAIFGPQKKTPGTNPEGKNQTMEGNQVALQ